MEQAWAACVDAAECCPILIVVWLVVAGLEPGRNDVVGEDPQVERGPNIDLPPTNCICIRVSQIRQPLLTS